MLARKLAELLHLEVNDPRLKHVVITKVDVSRDLNYAKAYFTPGLAGELSAKELVKLQQALHSARGYLRKLLAASCQLRVTPELTFIHDESETHRQRMLGLIDAALASVDE